MDRRRRNLVTTTRTRMFPISVVLTSMEHIMAPKILRPSSPPDTSAKVSPVTEKNPVISKYRNKVVIFSKVLLINNFYC